MTTLYKFVVIILTTFTLAMGQTADPAPVDSTSTKSPGKALLFSIIPGGGQLYNESPGKALLFAGAFSYFTYEYLRINQIYQNDSSDQLLHRSRNDQIWLMALTWVLNIADAYVEAQLWDFDEYDINDQVLSEDENVQIKETEALDDKE